jgi:hypothetical protein
MEGFNKLPKMQCFKEGGAVKSKYAGGGSCYKKGGHAESEEMSKDIAQDKSMVKRGVKQHEEALHKDEPKTKLKLKTGGKSKLVGKYKAGGSIKMKKDEADVKDIQKIKLTKTKKAEAPSAAMMAEAIPYKKGGAAKKYAEGGSLKEVDAEENPGLAKLPTNVRNKMGYAKKGGTIKKYADGGLSTIPGQASFSETEKMRLANRAKNRALLSPIQQRELDAQEAAAAAAATRGQGAFSDQDRRIMGRKKGGKC